MTDGFPGALLMCMGDNIASNYPNVRCLLSNATETFRLGRVKQSGLLYVTRLPMQAPPGDYVIQMESRGLEMCVWSQKLFVHVKDISFKHDLRAQQWALEKAARAPPTLPPPPAEEVKPVVVPMEPIDGPPLVPAISSEIYWPISRMQTKEEVNETMEELDVPTSEKVDQMQNVVRQDTLELLLGEGDLPEELPAELIRDLSDRFCEAHFLGIPRADSGNTSASEYSVESLLCKLIAEHCLQPKVDAAEMLKQVKQMLDDATAQEKEALLKHADSQDATATQYALWNGEGALVELLLARGGSLENEHDVSVHRDLALFRVDHFIAVQHCRFATPSSAAMLNDMLHCWVITCVVTSISAASCISSLL